MQSTETKFAEACEALRKANKFSLFTERSKGCTNLESKYVCAIAILKECGVVESFNESGQWGLTTGRVTKNNGTVAITETARNPFAAVDRRIMESLGFTDEQIRQANGEPPAGISESQQETYTFLRSVRISDGDARKLLENGYKF